MTKERYDLNVILVPHLNETQLQAEKDAVATQVERAGGEIVELDEWGTRRLAYPIRKFNEGHYLIYRLDLSGTAPKTIEAALRQRDNVMRVLVVKDRPEWKSKKAPKQETSPVEATAEAGA
ncbi:MAG TPA: 30S ribosomal protein S6 [Trueperaceae bacterium]